MSSDPRDDYDAYERERDPYPAEAAPPTAGSGKVIAPGVLMIVTALVNLVCAGSMALFGAGVGKMPREELEQQMEKQNPAQWKQLRDMGWSADDLIRIYVQGGYGGGAVAAVCSLITLLGGILLCARKGWGFAIFSSLVTALPCFFNSPCCLLGTPIGVWALIVLLQSDVKAMFR